MNVRAQGWVLGSTSLTVATLVVLGASMVGLSVSGEGLLARLIDGDGLASSSTHAASFRPLREDFVRRQLGEAPMGPAPAAAVALGPGERALAEPASAADPAVHVITARNDSAGSAAPIPSLPYRSVEDTSSATRQGNTPSDCVPAGGTVWYRFQPKTDTPVFVDTFGSSYKTSLGVYVGESAAAVQKVACDTNAGGNSQARFVARAGSNYFLLVSAPLGGGELHFEMTRMGVTSRESATTSGELNDHSSLAPAISAEGRFVAFLAFGNRIRTTGAQCDDVQPPTGYRYCETIVLRDTLAATSVPLLTVQNSGDPSTYSGIFSISISGDGHFIAFAANVAGLVPAKKDTQTDVFVMDTQTSLIQWISQASGGGPASGRATQATPTECGCPGALDPYITPDGRFVAYESNYANLVADQPPAQGYWGSNAFVFDRLRGRNSLASLTSEGQVIQGDSWPYGRSLSDDGRLVTFMSMGTNLPDQSAACTPQLQTSECNVMIYLRDLATGVITPVSVGVAGQPPTDSSWVPSLSGDGTHVVFLSDADNLVVGDTNRTTDVFSWERASGRITRVSVTSDGSQQIGDTQDPVYEETGVVIDDTRPYGETALIAMCHLSIPDPAKVGYCGLTYTFPVTFDVSRDGRYVVFTSGASNFVPASSKQTVQTFVHDTVTGATVLESVRTTGEQASSDSAVPAISADGRRIVFESDADNLAAGYSGHFDVYLHERW